MTHCKQNETVVIHSYLKPLKYVSLYVPVEKQDVMKYGRHCLIW